MILNIPTFFCDPYASWQKAIVESTNRLIRLFFPRSTDMSRVSHADVARAQFILNSRPRKRLNFLAPIDFF